MSEAQIIGIILGIIVAVIGLASTIMSAISYGFDNILTAIFIAICMTGLLIIGIVESQ